MMLCLPNHHRMIQVTIYYHTSNYHIVDRCVCVITGRGFGGRGGGKSNTKRMRRGVVRNAFIIDKHLVDAYKEILKKST